MKSKALKPVNFPWFDYSRYSFSLGLAAAGNLYLSGHSASEHDAAKGAIVVKGDMVEQARTAWTKVATILESGGCSLENVVRAVEYVTPDGIEAYDDAERVRRTMLGDNWPAINTVVVNQLLRPQALIEIEVVARSGEAARESRNGLPPGTARDLDGIVYLSSILPLDESGAVVGPHDVVSQTRAIFQHAARTLDPFGLGLSDIVKTVDYLMPAALADYKKTAQVRRECFAPVFPAATGIILPRVAHHGALIQIDIIASRRPHMIVNPGWASYANLTYSPAVRTGNLLFLAGQAALDPETGRSVHQEEITTQSGYVYEKILQLIEAAGGSSENLVKTIEYVTPAGLAHYRNVGAVRIRELSQPLPASTGVVCERLLRPEFQIEVDSFAIIN